MSENLGQSPEVEISEILHEQKIQEAWHELESDEAFSADFASLQEATMAAMESPEWSEIFDGPEDIRARWQQAVSLTSALGSEMIRPRNLAIADYLKDGQRIVLGAVERYGWVIPGVSFKFVEDGFQWIEHEGKNLKDHMFDVVDLRDMDVPAPIVTHTQQEFNALSEEETDALRARVRANYVQDLHGSGLNYSNCVRKHGVAMSDGFALGDLLRKRRFGVPDQDLSYDDIAEYAVDLLAHREGKEVDYGIIPPSIVDSWSDEERQAIGSILRYCYDMRSIENQPVIDTYSLGNILGDKPELLDAIVAKGVLQPIGDYECLDGQRYDQYYLNGPYFDRFFATIVTWAKNDFEPETDGAGPDDQAAEN